MLGTAESDAAGKGGHARDAEGEGCEREGDEELAHVFDTPELRPGPDRGADTLTKMGKLLSHSVDKDWVAR